jgi:2-keto-4-pentenoate hydratase/2-oxohepta-3-ene-1,7-dioic acid hydratase in catechol pathway
MPELLMAMLIVRYQEADRARWGRLAGNAPAHASDDLLVEPIVCDASTTRELLSELDSPRGLATTAATQIPASRLLSPVTSGAQLICQGLNYATHAAEAQQHIRRSNLIFAKASSSLTGPFASIVRPPEVELLDYEVEIGLVIRRDILEATAITDANIGDVVAAAVLCNDVSARDVMFGTSFLQWFQGKSYRTFCPAGPVLYWLERTEVRETLEHLQIQLSLNGELRQSASSAQLIFKPAETLAALSTQIDLRRGDMLLTGTPGGVTAPASPKLVEILKTHLMADTVRRDELRVEMAKFRPFMKPGDVVTATLVDTLRDQQIGGQENRIAAPNAAGRDSTTVARAAS